MARTDEQPHDLSSQLLTQEILDRSGSQPIYLSKIEVNGGEAFTNEFFKKLLRPLVENSDYTLTQLLEKIGVSHDRLLKTQVFNNVDISLHSDSTALLPSKVKRYGEEQSVPTKVVFDLEPTNLNSGSGFLNMNSDDYLNVDLDYLNNNFNENGERVEIGVHYNPYKPTDHLITRARMLASLNNPSFRFVTELGHAQVNKQTWQQCSETGTGAAIGLEYENNALFNHFKVFSGVELTKRSIHNIDDAAADAVKFFAGDFLKSALVNRLTYDRSSSTGSHSFVVSSEILSNQDQTNSKNQSAYARTEVAADIFKRLFGSVYAGISAKIGGTYTPKGTSDSAVHISDRFYLRDSLAPRFISKSVFNPEGGLQHFSVSGSLSAPVPSFIHRRKSLSPLIMYVAGSVSDVSNNIVSSYRNALASTGFGVSYYNQWANFDLSYHFGSRLGDSVGPTTQGVQFSVSIGGTNRI